MDVMQILEHRNVESYTLDCLSFLACLGVVYLIPI